MFVVEMFGRINVILRPRWWTECECDCGDTVLEFMWEQYGNFLSIHYHRYSVPKCLSFVLFPEVKMTIGTRLSPTLANRLPRHYCRPFISPPCSSFDDLKWSNELSDPRTSDFQIFSVRVLSPCFLLTYFRFFRVFLSAPLQPKVQISRWIH